MTYTHCLIDINYKRVARKEKD